MYHNICQLLLNMLCHLFVGMQQLLQTTKRSYIKHLQPECHVHHLEDTTRTMLFREFQGGKYVDHKHTVQYLRTCDTHIVMKTPHVRLHVICPRSKQPPRLLLTRVMRRIETLLKMYRCEKNLEFWLLPTSTRRTMPETVATKITPYHINGGFTYPQDNTVFIYRREEFPKVMLHETIHHLELDTSAHWPWDKLKALYSAFGISKEGCSHVCTTDLNPNEAVVEAWATIYHLAFLNIEYGIPWKNVATIEIAWALRQAKALLLKQAKMGGTWKEDTHAYSYVVLKSMLLWNMHAFITTPPSQLPRVFMDLVLSESRSYIQALQSQPSHTTLNTLRMTAFGDL